LTPQKNKAGRTAGQLLAKKWARQACAAAAVCAISAVGDDGCVASASTPASVINVTIAANEKDAARWVREVVFMALSFAVVALSMQ
jgi:hypothetical protein